MQLFLSPGTVHATADPAVISTVLGSCVAVCLWDRHLAIGGMNHFLLPRSKGEHSARYGDVAIALLLEEMQRLGCQPAGLRAKLFGGAAVLPYGPHAATVGAQNVGLALAALRRRGVPLVARRTGGQHGLFVRFHTLTGRAMVRELAAPIGLEQEAVAV